MTPPQILQLFQIAATTFGVVVGIPVLWIVLKAGRVIGRSEETVSNLTIGLERVAESLEHFAEKADARLSDHDQRLVGVETQLDPRFHVHKRQEDR